MENNILKLILNKYKPSKLLCAASVNNYIANLQNKDDTEIACLLSDYKDIYFSDNYRKLQKLDPLLLNYLNIKLKFGDISKIIYYRYYLAKPEYNNCDNLKFIMVSSFSKEKRVILFNKKGKLNALLMQLYDLKINLKEFKSPGSWIDLDNPYLNGKLLKYKIKDIKFFYQINFFRDYLQNCGNRKEIKISNNLSFVSWPIDLKSKFYSFIDNNWLKSQSYKIYKKDKKYALKFLNKHKALSILQINKLIKNLLIKIKNNLNNLNCFLF